MARVVCFAPFIAALVCVSGCASYLSQRNPDDKALGDGLVYYLPKRPIIVQVVVTKGPNDKTPQVETPSLVTADAVPDETARYLLEMRTNLVSENHVALGVSSMGLLQTSDSTVTSGLSTALANLATAAGTITSLSVPFGTAPAPTPPADHCVKGQTYNLVLWPETYTKLLHLCGFSVQLSPLGGAPIGAPPVRVDNGKASQESGASGVFYRTELAYQVTMTASSGDATASVSYVATSPDLSPIAFLPIMRTLFANNTVKLSMKDGEVTSFEQDNAGELVGLTSIPATVISAYFTAISNIVPKRVAATNAQMALAISNLQQQRCQAAIAANPFQGKLEADKDKALTNIKAACTATTVTSTGQ